jgi:hypothetical protein
MKTFSIPGSRHSEVYCRSTGRVDIKRVEREKGKKRKERKTEA